MEKKMVHPIEDAVVSMAFYREFTIEALENAFCMYFLAKEKNPNQMVIQKNFILHSQLPMGVELINRFGFVNLDTGELAIDDYFEFIRVDLARYSKTEDKFNEFLQLLDAMQKDPKYENCLDNVILLKAIEQFKKQEKRKNKGGK